MCAFLCLSLSFSVAISPLPPRVCVCNSMIDVSYLIIESELGFFMKKRKKTFL